MNFIKQLVPIKQGARAAKNSCKRGRSLCMSSSILDSVVEVNSKEEEVAIALGSNVGNRVQNLEHALERMRKCDIRVTRHGCLYETEPAYITDQPLFLNSAVRATTKLSPQKLLEALKGIERDMGRKAGIRYGPRPIDLDILFYGQRTVDTTTLRIPHEKIWERPFVLGPLTDVLGENDDTVRFWHDASGFSGGIFEAWEKSGGESNVGPGGMRRVLPVGGGLWDWSTKTWVMGVLNVTPDSFSDGGQFVDVKSAVSRARSMLEDGADIIDIGAQSTRPMATKLSPKEELCRLIPVLDAVRDLTEMEGKLISVDTFYSDVALEAAKHGANIVNDVSAGRLDPNMHKAVAGLKIPYVAMHMRGDPRTMQNPENLAYGDVCADVAHELCACIGKAELCGVPAWRMIVDPGVGFSKNTEQNLDIINGLKDIRTEMGKRRLAVSRAPLLVGVSRKKFLSEICGRPNAAHRDAATVACVGAVVLGGANIVRVHNTRDNRDAVRICEALIRRRK